MNPPIVMIVARSPFDLALMGDLLEANDITTLRARDPAEALERVRSKKPTVVVVDLDLPGEACRTLVDGLRREGDTRDIPVVVVGEKAQRVMLDPILKGCRGSLVEKPIDTSVFPRRVIQEIRRRTTQEARPAQV